MRITDRAAAAILNVMEKKKLDPAKFAFELKLSEGVIGIGFNKEKIGAKHQFGKLTVVVDRVIDARDIVVDFAEIKGKKGIIFSGDKLCQ